MANTRPVIKPFDSVKDVLVYGHDPVTDKNVRVAVDTSGALQIVGGGGGGGGGGDVNVMNFSDISGLHVVIDNFPHVQEISGNVSVMNWGDASGLYVTVTNPSSVTADISGQTVVINANAYSSSMFYTGNITSVTDTQIYGTITGNPAYDTMFLFDVFAGDKFYIYKDYQLIFLGTVQEVFNHYQLQLFESNGSFNGSFPYTTEIQYTKQVPSLDFDNNTLVNISNKVLTTTGTITGRVATDTVIENFPAPVVDVSATIVNWIDASGLYVEVSNFPAFPAVQDISGSVNLYALKPTTNFNYTQLTGTFTVYSGLSPFVVVGTGTLFESELAVTNTLYYIPVGDTIPILLGTVFTIDDDENMVIQIPGIAPKSDIEVDNYGLNIPFNSTAPTALVTHTGTDFLSVQVENTITEVNSADILSYVTSINGKITACDTGNVNINGFGTSIKAESISAGLADVYSDANGFLINRLAGQLGNNEGLFTSNACPIQADLSGCVFTKMFGTDTSGYDVPVSVDNFGVVGVSVKDPLPAGTNSIGDVTVSNFPAVQDISGSVNLYAEQTTYPYTQLAGTLSVADNPEGDGYSVTGTGTSFTTDFVVGNVVYYVATAGQPAVQLGAVVSFTNNTSMLVTAIASIYATTAVANYGKLVTTLTPVKLVTHLETQWLSVAVENVLSSSITTLYDVSAGTALTISSSPVTLTSWTPTNLGTAGTVAYYKFYNKVGATSSDTPLFTYPVVSSDNTINSIPLHNLKFTTACSVRATAAFDANNNTIPTGTQIANFLYRSL